MTNFLGLIQSDTNKVQSKNNYGTGNHIIIYIHEETLDFHRLLRKLIRNYQILHLDEN